MKKHLFLLTTIFLLLATIIQAQEDEEKSPLNEQTFSGLKVRNIGPGFASGRIADIAIHPEDDNVWYIAVGSGGVWKTTNAGVTWDPIFDDQPSYSIGCVTIDPNNPHTIWVGTGENVGGRHVGYGDGIYRSTDNGKCWTNMGLKKSEHISKIIVHPENSDVLWVAAQGPLWNKGDERGLYKTIDGGKTWNKVLGDDEWVGVTDVLIDPRNPDWLYAATWQRHRTVAAYMGGGPGSGIHRSKDGGATWEKLTSGIPKSNLGKIGLALSYHNPDVIYAAIEFDRLKGGVFISSNRGTSWTKQSDAVSGATGPHYYQELYTSPHADGRLYLMDVRIQVSDDHGKTFRRLSEQGKHSDNHAIAFRADDPDYLLIGTDGGMYESFDLGDEWRFFENLPLTQYYKVAVDDSEPFYMVYGGTQDNGSHGGPSQTDNEHGIRNADWFKTLGADGHQSATEPGNPNIMYAETQQGGLHRIDRITGEQVYIQPQAGEGESYERYNWDAPILVSPHDPTRLYFASQRVWRSDNRGDSWDAISGDLTRNQERIDLPIMGKKQSWDNPWDVNAMSNYNTITSLAESPLQEGLIYAGTDDGIIQVTEDGGQSWRKIELSSIPLVPDMAFVNDVRADLYDANTVYVALDNHKYGDFKPYLIKSTDRGKTWTSIAGDIPDGTLVWRIVQDHEESDLLFVATEFGIYFTIDGGRKWIKLKGGVPTISFRDITIQRRENDLVAASFGRGFYILDDYTPLRQVSEELLAGAHLFEVKDAWWYNLRSIVSSQGSSHYAADNPPFGATFTYYLPDSLKSLSAMRKEREKELAKQDADIDFPGWDALEAEQSQEEPQIWFTITDENGQVVNRVEGKASKGINRVSWNLNHASRSGIRLQERSSGDGGFMVTPGNYSVSMSQVVDGVITPLSEPQSFEVKPLREGALPGASYGDIIAFRKDLELFQQDVTASSTVLDKSLDMIKAMQTAVQSVDGPADEIISKIHKVRADLLALESQMSGSETKDEIGERTDPTPRNRMNVGIRGMRTTYGPTPIHKATVEIGQKQLTILKEHLSKITNEDLPAIERALQKAGAPWIEGQGLISNF
jgi:photosystem II stability/assembly factor-like uncharacterized protein